MQQLNKTPRFTYGNGKVLAYGNTHAKERQYARAKERHFGLKNSVQIGRLSTNRATARSVQLLVFVVFSPSFCFLLFFNR